MLDGVEAGSNEEPLAGVEEALGALALWDQEQVGHRVQGGVLAVGGGKRSNPGQRVEAMRTFVLIEGREVPDGILQPVTAMSRGLGEVLALHVEDQG